MRRFFVTLILLVSGSCYADNYTCAIESVRDQNLEQAFRQFLKALDEAPKKELPLQTDPIYQEALNVYLEGAHSPQETAQKLLQSYSQKSENLQLRLILALAYANLNQFEEFFTAFYPSYCAYPNHYLAYKTKAVLHIKLFERSRDVLERETEQAAIRRNVHLAIERNPLDMGLYKLWILFANEKNKEGEVEACLNKILNSSMIITRSDIPFFAGAALDLKRYDLGQRLIDKASSWYLYSRCLDQIREILKEKHDSHN